VERRRLRRDAARARVKADTLAGELEAAEQRLRDVEVLLCEPEVFADGRRARELGREADELRDDLEALLEAWGEAEEDAEALAQRLAELE
jgi:protein subunit release factor A